MLLSSERLYRSCREMHQETLIFKWLIKMRSKKEKRMKMNTAKRLAADSCNLSAPYQNKQAGFYIHQNNFEQSWHRSELARRGKAGVNKVFLMKALCKQLTLPVFIHLKICSAYLHKTFLVVSA